MLHPTRRRLAGFLSALLIAQGVTAPVAIGSETTPSVASQESTVTTVVTPAPGGVTTPAAPVFSASSTPSAPVRSASSTPSVPMTPSPDAPLIVIDPGHGGPFSNANANGLREKNVNLLVARALRDRLIQLGYRVIMTRDSDRAMSLVDIPTWNYRSSTGAWSWGRDWSINRGSIPDDDLQARADVANRAGADLFICVHANAARRASARGYETFASPRDALGRSVSRYVQRSVIATTGLVDRGAKTTDFYVTRWTDMPAILIESAFITNRADAALLRQPEFRGRIADGVAAGVDEWMATSPYRRLYPRIAGADLASFAASAAAAQFPTGAPVAVLANAERWQDAPGAAALASALGGPLLWTGTGGVDATTSAALKRLAPSRVLLVGTDRVIQAQSKSRIAAAAGVSVSSVTTLRGANASALSAALAEQTGVGPSGLVFVASSADTATLLAVAPLAASRKSPLLLATSGALSSASMGFLERNRGRIRKVVLVGSASRVPTSTAAGLPWSRYGSGDVVSVASTLNTAFYTERRANRLRPVVADWRNAPEYLTSAVRAAGRGMPLVPVAGRTMAPRTREWITNRRSVISGFEVHDSRGGTPLLMDHMLRKVEYL